MAIWKYLFGKTLILIDWTQGRIRSSNVLHYKNNIVNSKEVECGITTPLLYQRALQQII